MRHVLDLEFVLCVPQKSCIELQLASHPLANGFDLAAEFVLLPFVNEFAERSFGLAPQLVFEMSQKEAHCFLGLIIETQVPLSDNTPHIPRPLSADPPQSFSQKVPQF